MSRLPDDAQQRQLALDPAQSFICEAPAGSGKTELLTQRYLTLLARVNSPEEIIAITFTRKAAGEMRARIVAALLRGLDATPPASEHQQLTWSLARKVLARDEQQQWHIVDNPNRLQVLTFDSLCAKLANSLPLHSMFGAPPGVQENAEEFYRQAAQNLLQTLEQDVPWSQALAEILSRLDNNVQRLEGLFVTMLAKRQEWLPLIGVGGDAQAVIEQLEESLSQVRQDTIRKLKASIPYDLQKQLIDLSAFAASNIRRMGRNSPLLHCLDLDLHASELPDSDDKGILQWFGLENLLLKTDGEWRKSLNRRNGFPPGDNAQEKHQFQQRKQQCLAVIEQLQNRQGVHELLLDLRVLPRAHYNDGQLVLLQALAHILPVLSAHLSLVFREHNSVDFNEISLRADSALGALHDEGVSDLALKLDYKIQHILVDEFQDTSPSQVNLLKRLTRGWEPHDGRTLFCVGDAMQSIYGFRGANVGLFIHCIENGLGHIPLTPLRLTTNFRSQAGVVNWINQVFASAFPERNDISDGAVSYSPSTAFQEKLPERAVWSHGFGEGKTAHDEARVVLGIVRKSWLDSPDASIAILVRNRNHATHITPLLREAGIKYRAVDIEPLQDNIVIQDLMSLTHALLDPADRIAWLSILRAPWCGLSLVDLEAIANLDYREDGQITIVQQLLLIHRKLVHAVGEQHSEKNMQTELTRIAQSDMFSTITNKNADSDERELTADGRLRVQRVAPVLFAACEHTQRKSLRQWVEGTWIRLGGPACLTNAADVQNAELFFNLLDELDVNTILPQKHALRDAVTRLFAVPDPDASEKLQIMTIHKSKGLEFDTVIIPALQRTPRRQETELLRWYERINMAGQSQLLMAPITSSGKDKDPTYQHLVEQEKKKSIYENCRLLYVACTRAKQRLHLLAQVKPSKDENFLFRKPAKSALLYAIWQPLQARIKLYRSETAELTALTSIDEQDKPKYLQRLPAHWHFPVLGEKHLLDPYIPFYEHTNDDQAPNLELENFQARMAGTLIHRVIQQMGEYGIEHWSLQTIAQQRPVWRSRLKSMGLPLPQLDDTCENIAAAVQKILQDKQMHWLLSNKRGERRHEFPVTFVSNISTQPNSRHMVIDLLVRDENTTWIIDFKSSQPNRHEPVNVFLQREKDQYAFIMKQYAAAITALGYANIKNALYFPLLGELSEY